MAELRVERKRPKVWLWIVLLLVVALLVWVMVELFGGESTTVIEDNPVGAQLAPEASGTSAAANPVLTSVLASG